MSAVEPARERIARRLQDAVERVRQDMDQVEFWTEVLGCLSQPVPDYGAGTSVLNRFTLPQESPDRTKRIGDWGSNRSSDEAEILRRNDPRKNSRPGH